MALDPVGFVAPVANGIGSGIRKQRITAEGACGLNCTLAVYQDFQDDISRTVASERFCGILRFDTMNQAILRQVGGEPHARDRARSFWRRARARRWGRLWRRRFHPED